jgi:hypothetical protein
MFTALEDLNAKVDINSTWKMIRENIKMSVKESLGYYILASCCTVLFNGFCRLCCKKPAKQIPSGI